MAVSERTLQRINDLRQCAKIFVGLPCEERIPTVRDLYEKFRQAVAQAVAECHAANSIPEVVKD